MEAAQRMNSKHKPLVIELDDQEPSLHPHDAPDIQDASAPMIVKQHIDKKGFGWIGWIVTLSSTVVGFFVSIALWDFAISLFARNSVLGWAFTGVVGILGFSLLILVMREFLALFRLRRLDNLQTAVVKATTDHNSNAAKQTTKALLSLYSNRPELRIHMGDTIEKINEQVDAGGIFSIIETDIMRSLDAQAVAEIEKSTRQVATVTALVPLAFADVATAMVANIRMIRRIAQIYGGRGGIVGSWRLLRSVMGHLVATGAMAVGDDWLGSILGGSLFSKLSRRFGEGMINGALTARVGRAAMEVCRPMPFVTQKRPSVTTIVRRALVGVFDQSVD